MWRVCSEWLTTTALGRTCTPEGSANTSLTRTGGRSSGPASMVSPSDFPQPNSKPQRSSASANCHRALADKRLAYMVSA